MICKLIKTKKEYKAALGRLEEIFFAEGGTADEAELLALLIRQYEQEHFKIDLPTPIAAIKFRMEQQGLKQKDLATVLGHKSRAHEILTGKRKLNLDMIRKIHNAWGISLAVLIQEY